MRLTLLMLLLTQVLGGYKHIIRTKFKDRNKLIDFMYSVPFFSKYLDLVGNEETVFMPSIEKKYSLNSPQTIEYISDPSVSFFPILKKVRIKHIWKREENVLFGNINSYYINFDLKIYSEIDDKDIMLIFEADIKRKLFFVPNVALKYALNDFGNRFNEIINLLSDNVC